MMPYTQDALARMRRRLDDEIAEAVERFEEATQGRHRVESIEVRRYERRKHDGSREAARSIHAFTIYTGPLG